MLGLRRHPQGVLGDFGCKRSAFCLSLLVNFHASNAHSLRVKQLETDSGLARVIERGPAFPFARVRVISSRTASLTRRGSPSLRLSARNIAA